jgi:hypothetical protein
MERDTKRSDNHFATPEAIRDYAVQRFQTLAPVKYDAGQKQHGGLLTQRPLLEELEAEVIDLWFYLVGLRIRLEEADINVEER